MFRACPQADLIIALKRSCMRGYQQAPLHHYDSHQESYEDDIVSFDNRSTRAERK
jgi:hypothetical protein